MSQIGPIRILEDPYCPAPEQIRFPEKGPYWKRRNRKMRANPKNWSAPDVYFWHGAVICHPAVAEMISKLQFQIWKPS